MCLKPKWHSVREMRAPDPRLRKMSDDGGDESMRETGRRESIGLDGPSEWADQEGILWRRLRRNERLCRNKHPRPSQTILDGTEDGRRNEKCITLIRRLGVPRSSELAHPGPPLSPSFMSVRVYISRRLILCQK